MDAIARRSFVLVCLLTLEIGFPVLCHGQTKRSQNFYVEAETQALADAVCEQAERSRKELAIYWLGKELPPWPQPCPITVHAGPRLAAQGATTYNPRPVSNFRMEVIGTTERILDSVLPHEVTHTVLATHFGRPLPRWADEGICTTVEHAAERNKHEHKLREFLRSKRGIAMNRLFLLTEYPQDMLPMYAQGYSVCRFLVEQEGPHQFIHFLEDWMKTNSWTSNVKKYYGYDSLSDLQQSWLNWVADGSGPVDAYVSNTRRSNGAQPSVSLASANLGQNAPSQNAELSLNAPYQPSPSTALAAIGKGRQTGNRQDAGTPMGGSTIDSWYLRQRQQTAAGKIATSDRSDAPHDARPNTHLLGTTSAGRNYMPMQTRSDYSVSQPQDELRYGQYR
ncbi:hypothetical protein [Rhodopirellula sp. MGV]|uniref:hypothetical protein n=1 Tax=Rhodopirellula sp. MGV TaxID=2023130 RepID=UPI0018E9CF64|nr:hypothetical protein [Rhodopirellula sp. MGV]